MNALLLDVWAALQQHHSVLGIFYAGKAKEDEPQPFTRTERGLVLVVSLSRFLEYRGGHVCATRPGPAGPPEPRRMESLHIYP